MKRRIIVKLAFKNLLRYKRRTLITAGAIAFGLITYIWVDSILEGADDESVRNLKRYETAETVAAVPGYIDDRETLPLDKSFLWAGLSENLNKLGVQSAPRIEFASDLIFFKDPFPEDGNVPARIIALDPDRDPEVFSLQNTIVEGRWLRSGEEAILLGRWFAEDIGAVVGASLIALTETRDGYAQTIDLEIVGILDCPNPIVNREGVYIPLDTADYYLEMGGEVTGLHLGWHGSEIGIKLPDSTNVLFSTAGLELSTWQIQAADYVAVMDAEQGGSGMIIFLILIIAAVGISNTMLMAVFERSREVGMMRALGMSDRNVRSLFLWESTGIGLTGSVIGVIVGAVVNIPLVKYGLDYSALMRDSNFGYRTNGIFYGTWHLPGYLYAILLGVGLSVLVAALSIRRVLRLDIPASLRFS